MCVPVQQAAVGVGGCRLEARRQMRPYSWLLTGRAMAIELPDKVVAVGQCGWAMGEAGKGLEIRVVPSAMS